MLVGNPVLGRLASGDMDPEGPYWDGPRSAAGEDRAIESFRFKDEPLAVWRSLWRLHKSSLTNDRLQSG